MTDHPHIGVFQRAMAAFTAGDMEADYQQGREATFQMFARDFELSGGTYRPQLHDVLANDAHTVALRAAGPIGPEDH